MTTPTYAIQLEAEIQSYGLTDHEAARFLGVDVWTLRRWRVQEPQRGPRFRRIGRSIRYCLDDLKGYWNSLPSGGGEG